MITIFQVRITPYLDPEELDRRLIERKPRFFDIPGLIQKIYGRDEETGPLPKQRLNDTNSIEHGVELLLFASR